MKNAIVIQARMTSTRLPGKVLEKIGGSTVLERIINTIHQVTDDIILAIPDNEENYILREKFKNSVRVFCGEENDVMKRYIDCGRHFNLESILRVCSDNPFIQAEYLDTILKHIQTGKYDYVSFYKGELNAILTHYGFFTEAFAMKAAENAYSSADNVNREHVSMYFYRNEGNYNIQKIPIPAFISRRDDLRFTLDTEDDLALYSKIYDLKPAAYHTSQELIDIVDEHSDILEAMKNNIRSNTKTFISDKSQ